MPYIYAHKSKDNGQIFYIGRGTGKRLAVTGNRTAEWRSAARRAGYIAEILEDDIPEPESWEREIYHIRVARDAGHPLINVSLGGKGVNVPKRWWGAAMSAALKGMKRPRGEDSKTFKPFATKAQLVKDYKTMSSIEIAAKYGVTAATVCNRLTAFGIAVRRPGRERTPVRCTTTGKTYDSLMDAAKQCGVFTENIRKVLNGKYRHTGGLHFEFAK